MEGVPQEQAHPGSAELPEGLKELRACLQCKLIKQSKQFEEHGCENCPDMKEENVPHGDYTTPTFQGMIAMMDPEHSWVAKWQSGGKMKGIAVTKGMYAIAVTGKISR
eukprot:gb/GEZN01018670.1/.p1 GENE.gb/GEZN01018670.1/~~gb/GEZN01018670.1/.p1  ORF type:complete len:108 (+),score=20.90 gb/GEZN01018670.1/:368-691(+)